jgi:flavorubredoxin
MRPVTIVPGVEWVGALDPQLRVFDVIMRADHGTTYNAFLVRGTEKTALIEACKGAFTASFFETLRAAIDPAKIDYIILNHLEPDHSGALGDLLDAAPNATVIATRPGLTFARNIVHREFKSLQAAEGESLDLGGRKLRFLIAPNLHWPDTMFTYLEPDGILFPCDFLGAHYCDDRLFNDLVGNYDEAFHYYFQCIMRPFKEYVRAGLAKIEGLELRLVCPSHGPILRTGISSYLARYRAWSAELPREKKRLLVFYASAYGNTAKMAEAIAEGARARGAEAIVHDLVGLDAGHALNEVEAADGLALGSCTINADALEQAWALLSSLATVNVKKKLGASFGSYAWSGEGPKLLAERMRGLKFRVPEEPLRALLVPTENDLAQCREYGGKLAEAL